MTSKLPEHELWRFTWQGVRLHKIYSTIDTVARCGVSVITPSEWRGTGSQEEYEKAEAMEKCKNCLKPGW